MILKSQREFARKAFYAGIGAPVVAGRMAKDYADKIVDHGNKLSDNAQKRFAEFSKEGEKVTKQLRDTDVVEEIQNRVDFDKVQDRVEKMRDQLEGALESWRESFTPAAQPVKVAAKKAPAKKAPASKPAAKKPATKAASKPAAKKAPAKTTAKKTTSTAKKTTTAKKAPAKTTAKTTAKKTTSTAKKTTAAKK